MTGAGKTKKKSRPNKGSGRSPRRRRHALFQQIAADLRGLETLQHWQWRLLDHLKQSLSQLEEHR